MKHIVKLEIETKFNKIQQSNTGIVAAIDESGRAWAWTNSFDCQIRLNNKPTIVKALRNRPVKNVYVGATTFFATGEDNHQLKVFQDKSLRTHIRSNTHSNNNIHREVEVQKHNDTGK